MTASGFHTDLKILFLVAKIYIRNSSALYTIKDDICNRKKLINI